MASLVSRIPRLLKIRSFHKEVQHRFFAVVIFDEIFYFSKLLSFNLLNILGINYTFRWINTRFEKRKN
jgi:hypothetical protein